MAILGAVNQGALELAKLLEAHGAARELAKRLGIDETAVSRWRSGKLKPGTEMRALLEDICGIHWRLWDQEPSDNTEAANVA
jgi:transcriptional regulator with XRE-family HTH domain